MIILKKKKYKINVNGNRHNKKDGTPERDFIHINDLCEIHQKILSYLNSNKENINLINYLLLVELQHHL